MQQQGNERDSCCYMLCSFYCKSLWYLFRGKNGVGGKYQFEDLLNYSKFIIFFFLTTALYTFIFMDALNSDCKPAWATGLLTTLQLVSIIGAFQCLFGAHAGLRCPHKWISSAFHCCADAKCRGNLCCRCCMRHENDKSHSVGGWYWANLLLFCHIISFFVDISFTYFTGCSNTAKVSFLGLIPMSIHVVTAWNHLHHKS